MLRESYDSAYTLLFSGLAVVTLLCALMIWLTLCRKGRYPNPRQWILNPLIALHLGVSIATIGTHLSALYQKTPTRHQAELLLILRVIDGEWFRSVRNDGRAGKRSAPLSAARRRIRQSSSPPRRVIGAVKEHVVQHLHRGHIAVAAVDKFEGDTFVEIGGVMALTY